MFVLDVADQHFQHVFHGQVADHLVVGLLDQGEVRAALAELFEQARQRHVLGHQLQRVGQLIEVEGLRQAVQRGQRQQQVLDVQQADELAPGAVEHRIAAVLVAADGRQDLVQRCAALQEHQVLARVGPVHHFQLAELDRRGQHTHALVAGVMGAAGVQDQLQLVAAVVVLVVRPRFALAGDLQDGVGAGVEQVDGRVHQPVEQVQRHGGPQRQQLGLADGPGLGRQLADHDVQVGNDEERGEERDPVDDLLRLNADGRQQRFEQLGEGRLADPAEAEGGQGDAELAGGKIGVELVVHLAQDGAAPAVLFGDGLHAGRAQLDHGELGGNEEAVEQDEEKGEEHEAEIGEISQKGATRGRVHGCVVWLKEQLRMRAAGGAGKSAGVAGLEVRRAGRGFRRGLPVARGGSGRRSCCPCRPRC
ncbi:hypothetical protein D3C81_1136330 [compost metagenome]